MTSNNPLRPVAALGVDQVVRLEHFRREHPDVEIESPRQTASRAWKAVLHTANGYDEINRFELRDLLDELETRLAER